MRISDVAKAAVVGVETVRYYEKLGLIPQPPRPGSGYRSYPAETVRRILFIRNARTLGFTLREVERLLSLMENPDAHCGMVGTEARAKLAEVRSKRAALEELESLLTRLVDACPGAGSLDHCPILTEIEKGETPPRQAGLSR